MSYLLLKVQRNDPVFRSDEGERSGERYACSIDAHQWEIVPGKPRYPVGVFIGLGIGIIGSCHLFSKLFLQLCKAR
jgi:hypothetical protein